MPMGDDDSVFDWGRNSLASLAALPGHGERASANADANRAATGVFPILAPCGVLPRWGSWF